MYQTSDVGFSFAIAVSLWACLSTAGQAALPLPSAHPAGSGSDLIAIALSRRSLRQGDQGADVIALQRYLASNDLFPYVADGFYGSTTASGVSTFQRIRELPATGIADKQTLSAMGFDLPRRATTPDPARFEPATRALSTDRLVPGSSGSSVANLQRQLNDYGIYVPIDGEYGSSTAQGVRTFQRVRGLNVSGTADRETLQALGFSLPRLPYVAAVLGDEDQLAQVRRFFPGAFIDGSGRREFINIGAFSDRYAAQARTEAALARGFNARLLYD
ncbi:peptidoglycan-binding protein [Romeria aff. gracilis LEGE 07310]|uniref:Peptidoglycan-binding protein n=1 Tax=Vasconcelosia minhoensis LEGE 07310 TaxID=915328 RepID=A0A8J7B0W2_9CYAN|nr:peptidoglycan-binding protein [Romeria gracilis]MBE9080262.1 peptidoglycan-binding protein [Romeria aff. gracilis LEGE 07310]